jgi:CBS domain containing-hemolysin-like protein
VSLVWIPIVVLIAGLLFKAFFSAAELAVAVTDVRRVQEEAEEDDRVARRVLAFLGARERYLGATLTGGTLSVVACATASAVILRSRLSDTGLVLAGLGLGTVLALAGELVPRAWAHARTQVLLPRLILPLKAAALLFTPFLWLVSGATRLFARILHNPDSLRSFVTREELRALLHEGAGEEIKPLERQMLSRVLDFSEIKVEEVMVPLIEVHAIADDASLRDALSLFVDEGHSRLPVYSGRIDNIVGVLYAFDVLYVEQQDAKVRALMRPGKYVPETTSIDRVLADLQKSRMGMAIVVDEYGGAVGLISIEDILEQIVGDIEDEFDRRAQMMRRIGPHEYVVNARLKIQKLATALEVPMPEGDYETVGGMLLAELGRIPKVGETLFHGPLIFTVRKATERAIKEVQVVVKRPNEPRR